MSWSWGRNDRLELNAVRAIDSGKESEPAYEDVYPHPRFDSAGLRDMNPLTISIDGRQFCDFEGFVATVNDAFCGKVDWLWNGNLDAFADLLHDVDGEYRLVWSNVELSRHSLGHKAMVQWLVGNILRCHPDNIMSVAERLRLARLAQGPTLLEWLVSIIQECPHTELVLTEGSGIST